MYYNDKGIFYICSYWFVGCIDGDDILSTQDTALMDVKPPNCLCTGGCIE